MDKTRSRLLANTRRYRKTAKGVLTNSYSHQRSRRHVEYSLAEFHEKAFCSNRFQRLYAEWVKSGYQHHLIPTVDRINSKKGYTLDNIQFLTWEDNRYKQRMERRSRKGVVIQLKDGVEVARFKSQKEAVKKTGFNQSLISAVLNGRRNNTGGYQFIYENPELLKS